MKTERTRHLFSLVKKAAALLLFVAAGPGDAGETVRFPSGFLWGTATSAHQVEGNNSGSDWWRWEQEPGRIRDGDRSGAASDHYHRYPQDLAMARSMAHNAYRFSIEWARLEPREGQFDTSQVAHYRAMLEACRENGLTPVVTLFHFTLPLWVADRGGWTRDATVAAFERFARFAGTSFGDLVDHWCTLNEPVVYLSAAHGAGVFPPGGKDLRATLAAGARLAKGHTAAYRALVASDRHDADGDGHATRISIAKHLRIFEPARPHHPLDIAAARAADFAFNKAFMRAVLKGSVRFSVPGLPREDIEIHDGGVRTLDYLGINYYSRDLVRFDPRAPGFIGREVDPDSPVTDMGWEIYPDGFYQVLERAWRDYGLPILVTENGLADASDALREKFLRDHLSAMARAMADGVEVLGYLHWSLMDNFEWAEGFYPRFGLLAVDYATQQRTMRPSAAYFTSVIRAGEIRLDD